MPTMWQIVLALIESHIEILIVFAYTALLAVITYTLTRGK